MRNFYVRVINDGNTMATFTLHGSASMRGSVVRYFSAGLEITGAMRSASGWHSTLAPGARRQLRARVRISNHGVVGSRKNATISATWRGRAPDAVKGIVRVIR